jgi:phosphoribosylformylglycinamidine (FGAM) synthase-like amidotransferase family enzyme
MCTCLFQIKNLEKKLAVAEKELQHATKDNQVLAQYIDTKKKKKEA